MKRLLTIDAMIELVLASAFGLWAINARRSGTWATAAWLTSPVLWVITAAFFATAIALYALSRAPRARVVRWVGAANFTGGAAVVGVAIVEASNSDSIRIALSCAGIAVLGLGIAQIGSSRRADPRLDLPETVRFVESETGH